MVFTTPAPHRAPARVNEPSPYRFDGTRGAHEFSRDVIAFARGDGAAGARLHDALPAVFGVATTDIPGGLPGPVVAPYTTLPTNYISPIWDAIARPVPWGDTPRPFIAPTLSSMTGAVGDHVPGTEPTPGGYVTRGDTISPTPISGKLELDRTVWDMDLANPSMSAAMVAEMRRGYRVVLEARAAAALAAIASPTTIALTGTNVNAALTNQLRAAVVPGTLASMRRAFTGSKLHEALAAAVDTNGQLLLEPLNDDNGDGVWMANRPWRYSPALASGVSWLLDLDAVHGYATPPTELRLDSSVTSKPVLGIWGYAAVTIVNPTITRKITY